MKINQIMLALAVAREKSINKAAESLGISQPTASSTLIALEEELGFRLFVRSRLGMTMTAEGAEFIDHAEAIERSLNGISSIQHSVKRVDFRIVSIKFDPVGEAFRRLCKKYLTGPDNLDFSIQTIYETETAIRLLERRQADLAVAVCRKGLYESFISSAEKKFLKAVSICGQHLEITCSKNHPIIRGGKIHYDLFGQYPCYTSVHMSVYDLYVPAFLQKQGIAIRNHISINSGSVRCRLLRETEGYLVSMPIPEEDKAAFDLESSAIPGSELIIFAIYRNDPQKTEIAREFIELCKAQV